VPLRPLGVGDLLDGAFKAVRRNPRVMLGFAAGFAFVEVLLTTLIAVVAFSAIDGIDTSSDHVDLGPVLGADALEFLGLFATLLVGGVLTGLLTVVVTQDVLGRRPGAAEVWAQVRPRIWTLVGLAFVTSVLEFLGLIACIAPGVWLWGLWAVAAPACVVERIGLGAALRRSRALVRGTFWRVWGIRALGWLVASVTSSLISLPFTAAALFGGGLLDAIRGHGVPVTFLVLSAIGSLIGTTVTAPIRAGVDALLYVDLRMRKEGLDIALQQAAATPAPPLTAG
jgi:hypothetical protein